MTTRWSVDSTKSGQGEHQQLDQDAAARHSRDSKSSLDTDDEDFNIEDELLVEEIEEQRRHEQYQVRQPSGGIEDDYSYGQDAVDNEHNLGHSAAEEPDSPHGQKGKSNLKMAFMNMANSIVGAGIIGQPYAVRQSGLIGGIILLLSLTTMIDWTIRLILVNAKLSGTDTYQATVAKCFGKSGLVLISVAQVVFAWMGSAAFCVIIGDTFPHVINAIFPGLASMPVIGFLSGRNVIIVLTVLFIAYPLSLSRNIAKLAKVSSLALVSMFVIVLTVVIRGPSVVSKDAKMDLPLMTFNTGILQGVSVISFAFVCHHNSLLIFESLKKPTMDRFATVTHWSTGISGLMCMMMGVGGFLVFKDETKGNVLNSFPQDDIMANIARFCFGFNVLTTLPLEILVCREISLTSFYADGNVYNKKRHIISTTILVFSAMGISLLTCNLGALLELVGSTTACLMAYILPPACFIKLSQKPLKQKWTSVACVAFGFVVMILSTGQTLVRVINGTEEEHCVT